MTHSASIFQSAQQVIPGGVNSPVRAFRGVGGHPVVVQSGKGAYLTDVDGNKYIDYVCSWGPLIHGHAHPYVIERVTEQLQQGFTFGAPTEIEVKLAQAVCELMPSINMIRFVSSGTEAVMSAIRLARGFTGRHKIIKFAGCYHGHVDSMLVAAGSGALTLGVPGSAGVPDSVAQDTLTAEFNNLDEVAAIFAHYGDEIAAVIVEPVAGNMNLVMPVPGFLQGLRQLCDKHGSVLIFDEVITGFRVGKHGAQHHFGVTPDLTVLGKIIGGGFPAAAFGGRADIMQSIAPLGPVYQAGTLSGNPVAMAAGLATLELLSVPGFYETLAAKTQQLIAGLQEVAKVAGVPFYATAIGSMFGLFFTEHSSITCEADVKRCHIDAFKAFFHSMLAEGVYLAPSAFEVGFVSAAHSEQEIAKTIEAASRAFKKCQASARVA